LPNYQVVSEMKCACYWYINYHNYCKNRYYKIIHKFQGKIIKKQNLQNPSRIELFIHVSYMNYLELEIYIFLYVDKLFLNQPNVFLILI